MLRPVRFRQIQLYQITLTGGLNYVRGYQWSSALSPGMENRNGCETWPSVPALMLINCVILGRLHNHPGLRFLDCLDKGATLDDDISVPGEVSNSLFFLFTAARCSHFSFP